MVFSGYNILYYLLCRNVNGKPLLDKVLFFEGKYIVRENNNYLNSKNYSFEINKIEDQGIKQLYFIKQVKSFDTINLFDIDNEVNAIRILKSQNIVSGYLPNYIDSEFHNGFIILQYEEGETLFQKYMGGAIFRDENSPNQFSIIGQILSDVHNANTLNLSFTEFVPTIFQLNRSFVQNIKVLKNKNFETKKNKFPSAILLDKVIEIIEHKDKIPYEINALIHNDTHLHNFYLINQNLDEKKLKLIDWELTSFGDKYWDLSKLMLSIYSIIIEKNILPSITSNQVTVIEDVYKKLWVSYHQDNLIPISDHSNLSKTIQFFLIQLFDGEINKLMKQEELNEKNIDLILNGLKNIKNFNLPIGYDDYNNEITLNFFNLLK